MAEQKKEDVKLAYWICPCGKETVQPVGPDVKLVKECPNCKREHDRIREVDGSFSDFKTAPEWFVKEFQDHLNKISTTENQFRQLAFQECEVNRQKMETQSLLKDRQKHSHNIVNSGVKRLKLHRDKTKDWAYNPGIKKFLGRTLPPGMKEAK